MKPGPRQALLQLGAAATSLRPCGVGCTEILWEPGSVGFLEFKFVFGAAHT